MPQFFIDIPIEPGSEVEIRGAEARHISQVLRLAQGDWINLSDGGGRSCRAEILSSKPGSVRARIISEIVRPEGSPPPALALAIIKGERFEWALQKAVELGIRRIIPFSCARTVPQYADGAENRKLTRWGKIADGAAKQSGLPFHPQVDAPLAFDALCEGFGGFAHAILLYEGERREDVRGWWRASGDRKNEAPDLIIVGPEGGFTADEVAQAEKLGAVCLSLGAQILRVETAAVAAAAIWQMMLGNMDASR